METIQIFDPMWLTNLSASDVYTLYRWPLVYDTQDMVQALQFQNVIRLYFAFEIHAWVTVEERHKKFDELMKDARRWRKLGPRGSLLIHMYLVYDLNVVFSYLFIFKHSFPTFELVKFCHVLNLNEMYELNEIEYVIDDLNVKYFRVCFNVYYLLTHIELTI